MAFDAYLKLEGVDGEARRAGHEGEIEIMGFSFNGNNPASIGVGSGAGTGKVTISGFNCTKNTDASSVDLFVAMCSGKHFPEATVTLIKSGGEAEVPYITYTFKEVFIETFDVGGSAGSETPMENLSLAFGSVNWSYTQQDETGSATGSFEGGWDLAQNVKL